MNTECIYLLAPEHQSFKNYLDLAQFVENGDCERYANSIAKIIKPVEVFADINVRDGWFPGKKVTLSPGNLVLFVGGKLHYMVSIYQMGPERPAHAIFPSFETEDWFEDMILFDENPDFAELHRLPEPELNLPANAEFTYEYMEDPICDVVPKDFSFSGKRVCVHGKFRSGSRKEIEAYLKSEGATITGSVSKKTDLLLIGENSNFWDRGVKVQTALMMKSAGSPILILREKHVVDHDKVAAINSKEQS